MLFRKFKGEKSGCINWKKLSKNNTCTTPESSQPCSGVKSSSDVSDAQRRALAGRTSVFERRQRLHLRPNSHQRMEERVKDHTCDSSANNRFGEIKCLGWCILSFFRCRIDAPFIFTYSRPTDRAPIPCARCSFVKAEIDAISQRITSKRDGAATQEDLARIGAAEDTAKHTVARACRV